MRWEHKLAGWILVVFQFYILDYNFKVIYIKNVESDSMFTFVFCMGRTA